MPLTPAPALTALAVVLLACCAGVPAGAPAASTSSRPPVDVGHGSVEDVIASLEQQGLPCTDPVPADKGVYEQATTCTIEGRPVTLVHFFSDEQAERYERRQRKEGVPGVYSPAWGARVGDAELARRIAALITDTSHG